MRLDQLPGIRGQRDPQWANVLLGTNTDPAFNLYHYGCLITSLANMIWAMDRSNVPGSNPGILNNELVKRGGFDGGDLIWSAVPSTDTDIQPQGVTSDIHTLASWLAADNHYALVHVTGPGFPMHWLMGYGVQPGGEPVALDPWYADSCAVRGRYTFVEAHLYGDATPPNVVPQPISQVPPALPTPPVEAPIQEIPTAITPAEPSEPVQPELQPEPVSAEVESTQQSQVVPVTVRKGSPQQDNTVAFVAQPPSFWGTSLGQYLLGLAGSALTTLFTQLASGNAGDTAIVGLSTAMLTHLTALANILSPHIANTPSDTTQVKR